MNILLLGVGGQGTHTVMEVLGRAAIAAGVPVRALSRASLARLGGPVACHLRLGHTCSPLIPAGSADIVVSMELAETLRAAPYVGPQTLLLVNRQRLVPVSASLWGRRYPTEEDIHGLFRRVGAQVTLIPAADLLGAPEARVGANLVMLGALCASADILPRDLVEQAILQRLPQAGPSSIEAFRRGYDFLAGYVAKAKLGPAREPQQAIPHDFPA